MKYKYSEHWTVVARELAVKLGLDYIDLDQIAVIESQGSKTKRTIARIHALGKVMQLGMTQKPFYTIELLTEKFDGQNQEGKIKTIIHELLHIPACFGGGFRHHRQHVNTRTVENQYQKIKDLYT